MSPDPPELALLLEGVDAVERDLARNLLASAGIPVLVDEPDLLEGGVGGFRVPGVTRIYVPRSALARARTILDFAWGDRERGAAERA
jgi:hypothetical protein